MSEATHQRFSSALDDVVAQVRRDRRVLAGILCGSLSHDTVWEKSDIDLVLVTEDGERPPGGGLSIDADGVNVHAILMPRAELRKAVEGSTRSSFFHSFLSKGRLLYSHDPSIPPLLARLSEGGDRDRQIQRLRAATSALPAVYKAHKWLITRGDLEYAALYILHAAGSLADVEVLDAGELVDRETLPRALALNPAFFGPVYRSLLNDRKTPARVSQALDAVDGYLAERAPRIFAPLLDYLREEGEPRSCREIDAHFTRHFDVPCASAACEYLADRGTIGRAAVPARLTKTSTAAVQELAFFSLEAGGPPGRERHGMGSL